MDSDTYTCDQCGAKCGGGSFDISRNIERVHYKSPVTLDEVEVGASVTLDDFAQKHAWIKAALK
jgi:hypothetical protein